MKEFPFKYLLIISSVTGLVSNECLFYTEGALIPKLKHRIIISSPNRKINHREEKNKILQTDDKIKRLIQVC